MSAFAAYIAAKTAASVLNTGDYVVIVQGGVVKHADPSLFNIAGVDDATVAALPTITTMSSNITSLQSQVNAFGTQSTVLMRRGPATTITAATTVISDLTAANTAIPFVGDSGIVGFFRYKLTNTNTVGTAPVAINFLLKLAGSNSLNPGTVLTFNGAGASTVFWVDVFILLNAGSSNLIHNQTMAIFARPATTANSNTTFAYGSLADAVTASPLDMAQTVESSAFDIGTTQPSIEMRANMTTAVTNTTLTKMTAELDVIQDH